MKAEYRIFFGVSGFLLAVAVMYAFWTAAETPRVEVIGVTALLLSAGLTAMCGGFFWFVARRIDPRPEDRPDAEIADGAGEVGFFSPGSYWPFGLAAAASLTGLGLAFWMWWLIALGLIAVVMATCGLLFEYYTGTRRTAEH
ncbi:cytochrome c oxidase subunit 4 [Rhizomonospora bruguierae]|uniref:cytochrome c oxidase subunit 4 n=1 Tax=Rhizomonospora bruguierae TaxID=1581705 RepID=UPI001BCC7441|nr:cytochrome c oxidase subunit 4 [Micromonospora sp. NBRC 107566]